MLPEPSVPSVRSAPVRSCRSLKLAWTDPRSGDNLTISIRGGEQLLAGLEREGFTRLAEEQTAARSDFTPPSRDASQQRGAAGPRGALDFPPAGR